MKIKRPYKWGFASLSIVLAMALGSHNAFASDYIDRGSIIGQAGSIGYDGQITGNPSQFKVDSGTTDPSISRMDARDIFEYGDDAIHINGSNAGSGTFGGIFHFDHVANALGRITKNNGYLYVLDQHAQQWITDLNGNVNYVLSTLPQHRAYFQDVSPDNWRGQTTAMLDSAAWIVSQSGAIFTGSVGDYNYTVDASQAPTANSVSANVNGGNVTLSFNVTVPLWSQLAAYHYDQISITDSSGRTVWQPSGTSNAGQNNVQVESGTQFSNQSDTITHSYSFADGTYQVTASVWDGVGRQSNVKQGTFTVNNGTGGGGSGGGGGGGKCPAPVVPPKPADYVENYYWSPDGSGGQILTWTDSNWVQQTTTDAQGCPQYTWVDQPKTYTHDYPLYLNNMQVTGLFYDPGSPTNLWSPTSQNASQNNHDQFSNGSTLGGSQALPTFGNASRSPAVYVRIGGGFAFRLLWTGSPHDMPTSASVTYRLINPNGDANTWTKAYQLLPSTIYNMGDQPTWDPSGNGYPPAATEYGWAYTSLPKYAVTGTPSSYSQLAKWNLTGDSSTTSHVEASVTFQTGTGSSVTWNNRLLAQSLGYPTWYFLHQIPDPNAPYSSSQPQWNNSFSFAAP